MHSQEKICEQYRDQGFVVLPEFLPRNEIASVHEEALEFFRLQLVSRGFLSDCKNELDVLEKAMMRLFKEDQAAFIAAARLCQHAISMHRLALSPPLVDLAKLLGLEHPTICTRPVMYFNSAHLAVAEAYYKSPPHQDWRSMQGSIDSLVVWIPLVDVNFDLGALELAPQSHKRGLLPTETEKDGFCSLLQPLEDSIYKPVELRAGDAIAFSSFLVHRSGINITDRIRWSMHFRYNNAKEASFIHRRFPNPYIYKPDMRILHPDFPILDLVNKTFS